MGQTKKEQAETAKANAETRKLELEIAAMERAEQWENVTLGEHPESLIYTFDRVVDGTTIRHCMAMLSTWARRHPQATLRIVFHSPGGYVMDGLALFDFIQQLRQLGHTIETMSVGMAASMAGILLQAGDHRVIGANSFMLIHEVSSITRGGSTKMEEDLAFTKRLQEKLINILAERSVLSQEEIDERWKKTDWWLDADEALELGFVDEVR